MPKPEAGETPEAKPETKPKVKVIKPKQMKPEPDKPAPEEKEPDKPQPTRWGLKHHVTLVPKLEEKPGDTAEVKPTPPTQPKQDAEEGVGELRKTVDDLLGRKNKKRRKVVLVPRDGEDEEKV